MTAILPKTDSVPTHSSRFSSRNNRWRTWLRRSVRAGLYSLAVSLGSGLASPSFAAEQLVVRLGPVKQSVAIADLETFARTGHLPASLKPYQPFLTPDVRHVLIDHLAVQPEAGDKVVNDLLQSHSGAKLLKTVGTIAPDVSIHQLQTALSLSARQSGGVSLLGTLKGLPQQSVTIDLLPAIRLASQLNFAYLQSQSLSTILEQQLAVDAPKFQSAFDPGQPGLYYVRQRKLVLHDAERDREIPVDLYWTGLARGPLVVISHGFGADRKFLTYLGYHLASYGLTVAAIEHPGSNVSALTSLLQETSTRPQPSRILPATEFLDRPRDVHLVLDYLARLNRHSKTLKGKLNTRQVSVIGHSLGGYTALALAGARLDLKALQNLCQTQTSVGLSPADWLQCAATDLPDLQVPLQDPRVTQIVLLNPIIGQLFGSEGLKQVKVPTLMLSSTDDPVTPAIQQQLWPFLQLDTRKYLVTAIRGTHLSTGDPKHLNPALTANPFLRERQPEDTEQLRHLVRGLSLAFIQQQTDEAKKYAPFLSAAYVQSLSTAELPLRFNQELPKNLTHWLELTARTDGETDTPLRQLISAIHLEAIGAWNRAALAQSAMLRSLRTNRPASAPAVGLLPFDGS